MENTCVLREDGRKHLCYEVCKIDGEPIGIGFIEGGEIIIGGVKYSEEEYRKLRKGYGELRTAFDDYIPDKKESYFQSQLPSISHLQNVIEELSYE